MSALNPEASKGRYGCKRRSTLEPPLSTVQMPSDLAMNVIAATKRYVSDDRYKLRLFETVGEEVRRVSALLHEERFSVTAGWSDEEFRNGFRSSTKSSLTFVAWKP